MLALKFIVCLLTIYLQLLNIKSVIASNQEIKYASVIYRNKYKTPLQAYETNAWKEDPLFPVQFGPWLKEQYAHLLTNPSDFSGFDDDHPLLYTFYISNKVPLGVKLLRESWKLIDKITCRNKSSMKLTVTNAYSRTIVNLLESLNINDNNFSVYEAALVIELVNYHKGRSTKTDYVRIYYRTFMGLEKPHFIKIPNCGVNCPVRKFAKIYKNFVTLTCDSSKKGKSDSFWRPLMYIMAMSLFTLIAIMKNMSLYL